MGMTGIVVALSPERRRIVESDPAIVHDIANRSIKVPGRLFFDALRLPDRLRVRTTKLPTLVLACLEGRLGRGVGEKGDWAYGRPHVIEGEELGRLADALAAVPERATAEDPTTDEVAMADDALLRQIGEIVTRERGRGGALLVHIT
jgi:hypothetical protein